MLNRLIIYGFLILTVHQLNAQERFARIYDDSTYLASLITNVIPMENGYLTAGIFVDELTRESGFFYMECDQTGNFVYKNEMLIDDESIDMFQPNMIFDSAGFSVFGYQTTQTGYSSSYLQWESGEWPPQNIVFDQLGIGDANNEGYDYYIDSHYVYMVMSVFGYEGREDQDVCLLKYDLVNEHILWKKIIGDGTWRELRPNIYQVNDTSFLIGYQLNDQHRRQNNFDFRTSILKMDTSGQILDRYTLTVPDRLMGWPTDIISASDGGFIVTSRISTEVRPDIGIVAHDGYVFKLDEDLDFVWGTEIKGDLLGGLSSSRKILALKNDYIVSGHLISYDSLNAEWSESLTSITRINEDGEILATQFINFVEDVTESDETHFNYDMRATHDGGFILSGSYQDFKIGNNGKQRGYLIKLDQDGCLIPNCGISATDEPVLSEMQVICYPNPVSEVLTFQIKAERRGIWSGEIINGAGEVINRLSTIYANVQNIIDVRDYPEGIYFIRLGQPNGIRVSEKFIVQR